MNKRIIGLILAGLICIGGQVTASYANENLREEVKSKTEQARSQNGWVKDEYDGWEYYKNGERIEEQWLKDNGKWYYFGHYGNMYERGSYYIGGKYYAFDNSGAMIEKKGWIKIQYDEEHSYWLYGNGDGTLKTEQWINENGKWYYADYDGWIVSDRVHDIGNKSYIFDKNGAMSEKKGWIHFRHPEDPDYRIWYYGNGDGTVKREEWIKDNGKWYYVDYDGWLITNSNYGVGNNIYLFDSNGAMIEKKGWIYLKFDNGYNSWFYGNGDGTVKREQWIKDNGKWYYVEYGGHMVKDESLDINGKEYIFDSNGVCINPY